MRGTGRDELRIYVLVIYLVNKAKLRLTLGTLAIVNVGLSPVPMR